MILFNWYYEYGVEKNLFEKLTFALWITLMYTSITYYRVNGDDI